MVHTATRVEIGKPGFSEIFPLYRRSVSHSGRKDSVHQTRNKRKKKMWATAYSPHLLYKGDLFLISRFDPLGVSGVL